MSAPLHVAVDAHDLARDERGIGRYARALLMRYAQRDDVRLTLLVRDLLPQRHARSLRAAIAADERVAVANRIPRDAAVVWHPWNGTFVTSPVPSVVTLHDVAPFAFPAADPKRRALQQAPFLRSAASAAYVLTDSAFTANEAQRYLHVPAARLETVPLGVDAEFSPGPPGALPAELHGMRYVLHVGAHDPHKNLGTLVAAFRAAFGESDCKLVCTRHSDAAPDAFVVRSLDTAGLVSLYRAAMIVAVPSLYEGFGLPVLEAMACGAPVLASRRASLPEVGGDAVRYVDAADEPAAWARALAALAGDPAARAEMSARGPERARAFSWERCAETTLEALRRAAAVPA